MSSIYFEYFKKGKCKDCGDIIWIETSGQTGGVICKCYKSSIIKSIKTNLLTCTDEELITAIETEYPTDNKTIVLIKT